MFILTHKKCARCRGTKGASEFGKNPKNKDGLKSWCRSCCAEHRREWAKAHPDRITEFRQADYGRHSDGYKARSKKRAAADPQRKKREDAIWRENNKERKSLLDKLWRQSPEGQASRFANHMKRRLQKKSSGTGITKQQYKEVTSDPCVYCGSRKNKHLDHITPIARGGADCVSNAAPACGSCNHKKGAKSLLTFLYDVLHGNQD